MSTDEPVRETEAQLRSLDEQIAATRASAAELRQQVGSRGDGTLEPEEIATTLASAAELDAIVESLLTRRRELERRLSQA